MAANRISLVYLSRCIAVFTLLIRIPDAEGFIDRNGVVIPKDPFKFVGETLILYCNITSDSLVGDSSDLYFELKRGQNSDVQIIPPRYIERLTTKSVRLRLPSVQLEHDGTYSCNMKTFSKPKYIGHQIVKVDYPPRRIEDVSCRVMNWREMVCNWTLGVNYQHMEDLKVKLVWTIDGVQKHCPRMAGNKTSCTWPTVDYVHTHKYLMILVVENLKRNESKVYSPQFNVETRLYVNSSSVNETETGKVVVAQLEPAPINNFQAIEENSTCIILSWQHSSSPERNKVFIGQYKAFDAKRWMSIPLNSEERKRMNTTVCGLAPNTWYTFRMKVMPFPEIAINPTHRNGFPSVWKTVSAETREDVPDSAPQICTSCFYEPLCDKYNGTRCPSLRIYWKEIPISERNGLLTGYQLTLEKSNFSLVKNISQKMKYYDLLLPSLHEEYKVTFKAATKKGFSNKISEIFIPSTTLRPEAPHDFLVQKDTKENGQSVYYLHWDADKSKSLAHKTTVIVWCYGDLTDFTCQDNVKWTKLPAEKVTHIITPSMEEVSQGSFIFGIAREVFYRKKIFSSGIQWASCIYHKNGKRPSAPVILEVRDLPQIKGLAVRWKKNDCPKDRVYVTGYSISLCKTRDEETCIADTDPEADVIHVNNTRSQVAFEDLTPFDRYLVHVWAESNSVDGVKSKPAIGKVTKLPENEDMNTNAIIIIIGVCGGVFVLIFILFICCCRRYCIARREKIRSLDRETIMPYAKSQYLGANHVQRRPLPEVPMEEHHYGLNACMNNHGSEKGGQGAHSMSLLNGNLSNGLAPVKTDSFGKECRYGNENAHQLFLPPANDYEENVGMFPLPRSDSRSSLDLMKMDMPYETPVIGSNDTLKSQTPNQITCLENKPEKDVSLNSSGSSGVVADLPYLPHNSELSKAHPHSVAKLHVVLPSDSAPTNKAAPPPPSSSSIISPVDLPHGQDLKQSPILILDPKSPEKDPCITMNNKNAQHKPRRNKHCGSNQNVSEIPSSSFILPLSTEIPLNGLSHSPEDRSLPNDYSQFVSSSQNGLDSLTPKGHSTIIPTDPSHFHSPTDPSKYIDSQPQAPNLKSVDTQTFDDYITNFPSNSSRTCFPVPHDYSRYVVSDSSDVYSQTPEDYTKALDSHSATMSNGWTTPVGSNSPNTYSKLTDSNVPHRRSVRLSDLIFPPPPSHPPPSSETNL